MHREAGELILQSKYGERMEGHGGWDILPLGDDAVVSFSGFMR